MKPRLKSEQRFFSKTHHFSSPIIDSSSFEANMFFLVFMLVGNYYFNTSPGDGMFFYSFSFQIPTWNTYAFTFWALVWKTLGAVWKYLSCLENLCFPDMMKLHQAKHPLTVAPAKQLQALFLSAELDCAKPSILRTRCWVQPGACRGSVCIRPVRSDCSRAFSTAHTGCQP